MALPGDVTTFTLTFGPYTDASGAVVTTKNAKGDPLTAKLHAIDLATGRRLNVTDVATGQVVVPKDLTVTIGSDGTGSIGPLPHTDNPGLSTVGFGYWVEWDIASGSHSYTPGNKRFAVPASAGATVDFDLLDVAAAVPGVLVPVVTGATGPAGTITSASATGLTAGAAPTVTLGGTPSARTIELGIPAGATGPAGTITSASASALAPGATPTVTLGGTPSARTMAFGLPGAVADDASVAALVAGPGATATALKAAFGSRVAPSAITEWWINPVATKLSAPYERVVSGELGEPVGGVAKVLFVERNLATGTLKRHEVAQVTADDHCVPALHAEAGRRFVMVYQNHNGDQLLRFKVSARNGAGYSFVVAPEVTRSMGASVSYADVKKMRHLSDATQDTFAVIYRHGTFAWAYQIVTVNQATGAVTFGTQRTLIDAGTEQCYLSVADDYGTAGQVLRLGFGYNPTAARHSIRYLAWNVVTGEVANQNGTVLADTDTGTGLPIVDTALSPIVAEPTSGNRRFVYTRSGPDDPAVLYVDYDEANVAGTSRYKLTELYGETIVPGDAFNGLLPGATPGYASAPAAAVDLPGGFTFTWVGRLPAAARASSLAHRYDGTTTGVWWLRIDASGNIGFWVRTDAATTTNYAASAAPLAAQWGNEVGIRLVIDLSLKQARRYYSLDPRATTPTWTQAGTAQSINAGSTAIATSATLPLVVSSNSASLTGVQATKSVALLNAAGTEVAATDFEATWVKGDTTDTDAHGVVWTLNSGATIGNTGPQTVPGGTRTHDLGPAGDYFGYTYLRGGAFETPSNSGAVLLSRNSGATETLDRLMPDGAGGWTTENLLTAPTTAAKIVRPYSPVDAGPGLVLINKVTAYSSTGFTSWASSTDLIAG